MHMLAVALLMLLEGAAGAAAGRPVPVVASRLPPPSSPDCPQTTSYHAFDPARPVKPQKLGELPPANVYAAMWRHDGKCEVPMVIKFGVGG